MSLVAWRTSTVASIAAVLLAAAAACPAQEGDSLGDPNATPARPPTLMLPNVEREIDDMLGKARAAIRDKQYDKAIEILQGLIGSDRRGFYPMGDDERRCGSVAEAARRVLATMPPEGMDLHARLYDPPARKLLAEAQSAGDEQRLRHVAEEYFQTPSGLRALELLAQRAFEAGAHLEAASAWQRVYRNAAPGKADSPARQAARAMLLVKAGAAYHLAGAARQAAATCDLLLKNHPDARGVVAGREVPLVRFLAEALTAPAGAAATSRPAQSDWPCPGGAPDGAGVMGDCNVELAPLSAATAAQRQARSRELMGLRGQEGPVPAWSGPMGAAVEGGAVVVSIDRPGLPVQKMRLGSLVCPLVVGNTVICRWDDELQAASLDTGRPLWRIGDLPLYRRDSDSQRRANRFLPLEGDMGRLTLSAGGGRLYTVCRFQPIDPATYRKFAAEDPSNSSLLAAVELPKVAPDASAAGPGRAPQPKVVWEIGCGRGANDALKGAKYLAAPTYHDGRLHALARLGNRYCLFCLDAATGTEVWHTPVGPVPIAIGDTQAWQAAYVNEMLSERGSPPSLDDRRLYVATNAGLVAAFDLADGKPQWSYQYDSRVCGPVSDTHVLALYEEAFRLLLARRPVAPQNPVVLLGGRVICLPADANSVLALNAASGELLWQADRGQAQHLTAIDDQRVLLSGPDLTVLRASDGKELKRVRGEVWGRPAVTPAAVLASVPGGVLRMDLASYAVTNLPLLGGRGVLGRLVSAGGRLVAANAADLSIYPNYEQALASLEQQLAAAKAPTERAELHISRGLLALRSGRLEQAAGDFEAAGRDAATARDADRARRARELLGAALLGRLGEAKETEAAPLLSRLRQWAAAPGEKARLLLASAACEERFGRPAKAVELLQDLAEKFAGAELSEGPPEAAGGTTESQPVPADDLAQREIGRLIGKHGQSVYAAQDARFAQASARAKPASDADALLAACERWPHAAGAGAALLAAGEMLFVRATAKSPPDVPLAARAARALGEAQNRADAKLRTSVRLAQAVVDARFRPWLLGAAYGDLAALPPTTAVRFAGVETALGRLLAAGPAAQRPASDPFCWAAPPLRRRAAAPPLGQAARLLRDADGRTLHLGQRVFLVTGGEVTCWDAGLDDPAAAKVWSAPFAARGAVGHLSADGSRLALAAGTSVAVLSSATGEVTWQPPRHEWPADRQAAVRADGDWLVVLSAGRLWCVDIRGGRVAWADQWRDVDTATLRAAGEALGGLDRNGGATCRDMRSGGVLMALRPSRRGVQADLSPDGLAVVLDGNALEVYDPRRDGGTLIAKAAVGERNWSLLSVSRRYVVLGCGEGAGTVAICDMADPSRPVQAALGGKGDSPRLPAQAETDAKRVYVLWARRGWEAASGGGQRLDGPALTALSLAGGKALWTAELASPGDGAWTVRLVPCGGVLAVALGGLVGSGASRQLLVGADSGAVCDAASAAAVTAGHLPPAVLNGRVVLEGRDGVVVLRSRP